jgi:hypothetical protein
LNVGADKVKKADGYEYKTDGFLFNWAKTNVGHNGANYVFAFFNSAHGREYFVSFRTRSF